MKSFLIQVLASSLAFATAAASRPNVILILADDLDYGDISSYGVSARKPGSRTTIFQLFAPPVQAMPEAAENLFQKGSPFSG